MISDMGYRVALIDIDFGLNNLDVVMGLNNYVTYDMCDVFEGRCRIKQALIKDVKHNNLYLMPSDKMKSASMVSGQNVKLLLEGLNSFFDYIFLDCPAGIDVGFHRAVACAESAIVVLTPNMSSIRDADQVVSILKSYKLDIKQGARGLNVKGTNDYSERRGEHIKNRTDRRFARRGRRFFVLRLLSS